MSGAAPHIGSPWKTGGQEVHAGRLFLIHTILDILAAPGGLDCLLLTTVVSLNAGTP